MQFNRDYLAFGLALIIAFSLMGLPLSQKEAIASLFRSGWGAVGQWVFSRVIDFAHNEAKSRFLLEQNVEFALENMRLKEAGWENERLRQALKFQTERHDQHQILAEVIGRDPNQLLNALVINAGRDRGVEVDWPVVTARGLVGHVVEVADRSAIVQLILRPGAGISALIQERRAQGIVNWQRGKRFKLEWVDVNKEVQIGDRVICSGLGGRYPQGVLIGHVVQVGQGRRDPLFQDVFISSSVDFWNLEEVFVMRPHGDDPTGLE